MKKDRISCLRRSIRNQPPRTKDRFIKLMVGLAMQDAANSAWGYRKAFIDGLDCRVGHSPPSIYSTHYDFLWFPPSEDDNPLFS